MTDEEIIQLWCRGIKVFRDEAGIDEKKTTAEPVAAVGTETRPSRRARPRRRVRA